MMRIRLRWLGEKLIANHRCDDDNTSLDEWQVRVLVKARQFAEIMVKMLHALDLYISTP
jgi:hypothetical protein